MWSQFIPAYEPAADGAPEPGRAQRSEVSLLSPTLPSLLLTQTCSQETTLDSVLYSEHAWINKAGPSPSAALRMQRAARVALLAGAQKARKGRGRSAQRAEVGGKHGCESPRPAWTPSQLQARARVHVPLALKPRLQIPLGKRSIG